MPMMTETLPEDIVRNNFTSVRKAIDEGSDHRWTGAEVDGVLASFAALAVLARIPWDRVQRTLKKRAVEGTWFTKTLQGILASMQEERYAYDRACRLVTEALLSAEDRDEVLQALAQHHKRIEQIQSDLHDLQLRFDPRPSNKMRDFATNAPADQGARYVPLEDILPLMRTDKKE
jgi:hypothetical protein